MSDESDVTAYFIVLGTAGSKYHVKGHGGGLCGSREDLRNEFVLCIEKVLPFSQYQCKKQSNQESETNNNKTA